MNDRLRIAAIAAAVSLLAGCAFAPDAADLQDDRLVPPDRPPSSVATAGPAANEPLPFRDRNDPLFERLVLFDFDSHEVKPEYAGMLKAHSGFLGGKPTIDIVVQGNADERGSREYNLALGQLRAEAVKRNLELLGVRGAQIEAVSFGEERPRDPGRGEEAWRQNRNAAIAYPGEY